MFNIFKFNNQYDMSTSVPTAMHAICINIRTKNKPIIRHEIYVLKRYKGVEKLSTLEKFVHKDCPHCPQKIVHKNCPQKLSTCPQKLSTEKFVHKNCPHWKNLSTKIVEKLSTKIVHINLGLLFLYQKCLFN